MQEKLRDNPVMKAFYHLAVEDENGKVDIKVVLLTHVDDVMWAAKPGYENIVPRILEKFEVRKVEESKFRFCGKEFAQDDDFTIRVTCKDNIANIEPIRYDMRRKGDRK